MHPLAGIKVLELAGLAPAPFAGMMLADFGADVIRVDRIASSTTDVLGRGKRSISLNLKSEEGRETLKKMMAQADVVIDPFRPGVLEKLGLGPDTILKLNPKCVFARLTGFGQYGDFANMAGHDINYIAISGALSAIGRAGENPMFPANLLGDFAGGGMLCVVGILISLIERQRSGLGQVVDAAMVDGSNYLSAFIIKMRHLGLWNAPRGKNVLDSGAPFYETYRTKDGKFLAVGSIEPQFYKVLLKGLNVDKSELPDQLDTDSFDQVKAKFTEIFLTKTRDEWTKIFNKTDACVTPILEWDEVMALKHNKDRQIMVPSVSGDEQEPRPAPRLSRTPGRHTSRVEQGDPTIGQHTEEVLTEFGFGAKEIQDLKACKAVLHAKL